MGREKLPAPDRAEAGVDERADRRVMTIYRLARAATMTDEGLCRVVNISDGGMKITTGLTLRLGEMVWVSFSDKVMQAGSVIWMREREAGLQFANRIDSGALLHQLAEDQRLGRSRQLRLPVDALGVSFSELGVDTVRVLDISRTGMKLAHRQSRFQEGLRIKIRLTNGIERRGVVRWSDESVAGVQLLEPIEYADLESARRLTEESLGPVEKRPAEGDPPAS